jgi:hypothetical protein
MAQRFAAFGLMRVNRNTWRNLYEARFCFINLSCHALRKNEDQQPGGQLAQATYSAYNGDPAS